MVDRDHINLLIDALDDGNEEHRLSAMSQLQSLGDQIIKPLIDVMLTGQGRKARISAELLGELAHPQALDALFTTLCSDDPLLGGGALKAILQYPSDDVVELLAESLPNTHIMVQQSIIIALQRFKDIRSVSPLVEFLDDVDSPTMRCAIIKTLGILGDPQAIPIVQGYLNDSNHHVREWAVTAFQQLQEKNDS